MGFAVLTHSIFIDERLKIQVKESHVITKSFNSNESEYVPLMAVKNPYMHVRIAAAVERADTAASELMKQYVE